MPHFSFIFSKMPESLFLINSYSAKVKEKGFENLAAEIYAIYRAGGATVEVRKIDFALLASWIENAHYQGIKNIFAVGGDGTANAVGALMVGKKHLRLGIIPLGSGNGLARNVGFSTYFSLAVQQSLSTQYIEIDAGRFGQHIFLNAAGLGLDADVVTRYQHSKTRGMSAYAIEIAKSVFSYPAQQYEVEIDGNSENLTNIWVLSIMNGTQWGYDAVSSPDSLITDGYFELITLKKSFILLVLFDFFLLFIRKVKLSPRVKTVRCKNVRIFQSSPSPAHVDGEHISVGKEIEAVVLPKALCLLLPKTLTKEKIASI